VRCGTSLLLLLHGACAPSSILLEHGDSAEPALTDASFSAPLPALGLELIFDAEGPLLTPTTFGEPADPLRLQLEAWGHDGALVPTLPVQPSLGGGSRVHYDHGNLDAWWVRLDTGVEQGWTVQHPPPGLGPLIFETRIEGAYGLEASDDSAWFEGLDGRSWSVSHLAAWDARGEPLPVLFEAEDEILRVVVDVDGSTHWPITVDPFYSTAASTLTGTSSYWFYGINMATAGDVNGDGYDDLLTVSQDGIFSTGIQYVNVIHGYSGGVYSYPHQIFSSYVTADYLGYDVGAAGDVNGDGYDDIIVGAQGSSASHAGRVYIHHGSSSGAAAVPARTLAGTSSGSTFGGEVTSLGDINGDGYDDIAVCGGLATTGLGQVSVFLGSASGIGSSYYQQISDPTGGGQGWCQAISSGDFNGDGYGDLAVAAPYADYSTSTTDSGKIYVYHSNGSYLSSYSYTTISSAATNAHMGGELSGGWDIDGDGYQDLVAGTDIFASTSFATVYYGGVSGLSSGGSTLIFAPTGDYYFGNAVTGVPDVNGDGYDDVAIGDEGWDAQTGRVWLYHGSSTGLDTTVVQELDGETTSDYFGSMLAAGDYDGDGFGDITVGAESWGDSQGRVYVYLGYDGDDDGDGVDWEDDCDDTDPSVGGPVDWYADGDRDGYGDAAVTSTDCTATTGYVADDTDCDDSDAGTNPGAQEVCDTSGVDEDCDGMVDDADPDVDGDSWLDWYEDGDGDGYGDSASLWRSCRQPTGWVADSTDCDDSDASVSPGAAEICDPADVDEDCDGLADDADSSVDTSTGGTWYDDIDGDGFGDSTAAQSACGQPSGTVADATDCDDSDASIRPGGQEICDSADVDEDCDGLADDADSSVLGSSYATWYSDTDGDGYGDPSSRVSACDAASGQVADDTDCDDTASSTHPGAVEYCDPADTDEDCNGLADDLDPSVASAGKSDWYADADRDGYGDPSDSALACDTPAGRVADDTDCDDSANTVNPGATEQCDAGNIDEDCDGLADDLDSSVAPVGMSDWYADGDADGYGDAADSERACDPLSGRVVDDADCDDGRAGVNPAAQEVCDAGDVDEDCDGLADDDDPSAYPASMSTWYSDMDRDGYGDPLVGHPGCDPSTYGVDISLATDCDDANADINPDGQEVCDDWDDDEDCDGLADDADPSVDPASMSTWFADADGDGYGDPTAPSDGCDVGEGEAIDASDCDDDEAGTHPGATEIPNDGVDQDCDGADATEPTGDDTGEPSTDDTGDGGGKTGCSAASAGSGVAGIPFLFALLGTLLRRRQR